jgi:heme exporter protein C
VSRTLGWLAAIGLVAGLVMAFGVAPREVTQGNAQRIMYLHVPMAIVAEYLACPIILVASIGYLWKRWDGADRLAHAAAEVGVLFTGLTIATGSIWGKPTWGAWWTWDARITTVSILLVMLVGYLLLRSMVDEREHAANYAAVLGIVLALNVPLVHFSVYWWRTLHQPPSLLKPGPATVAWPILVPLLANVVAYALLYVYFVAKRVRLLRREAEAIA